MYRTVVEQMLREPERAVQVPVPGETRQVARQVIDHPAYDASARFRPSTARSPSRCWCVRARDEAYTIPAVFRTVENRRLASPARYEWRHSACKGPAALAAAARSGSAGAAGDLRAAALRHLRAPAHGPAARDGPSHGGGAPHALPLERAAA